MNNLSIPGLLIAAASFALTFFVARMLGRRFRNRRKQQANEAAQKGQSRQVRRAHARQSKRDS